MSIVKKSHVMYNNFWGDMVLRYEIAVGEVKDTTFGGTYTGYGIIGVNDGNILCSAEDVSECIEDVLELIALMNENEADIIHFDDIIEDFIS